MNADTPATCPQREAALGKLGMKYFWKGLGRVLALRLCGAGVGSCQLEQLLVQSTRLPPLPHLQLFTPDWVTVRQLGAVEQLLL